MNRRPRPAKRRLPLRPAHLAVAVAAAGAVAFVLGLVAIAADYRPVGKVALLEAALRHPVPTAAASPVPVIPDDPAGGEIETAGVRADFESLQISPGTTERPPIPARLVVEAIGVDANILPLGLDGHSRQMEVPHDVDEVGWYRHGPGPGQPGSAVLAAHVDGFGQGRGAFFALHELEPGDEVRVMDEEGEEHLFVVAARTDYHKTELPVDVIFSRRGEAVLTLITCGGGFNDTARSYDSNVVVYAVPAATAPEYLAGV